MLKKSKQALEFDLRLAAERPRLVRLCRKFSGRPEAAEDLAQETMVAAWKSQSKLVSMDKMQPWTSAIARNVCLNWARRYYREEGRTFLLDQDDQTIEEVIPDEFDVEFELDRVELATLLDRALALLPPETAQILIAHYLEETSQAEIAEQMNINAGTIAVRLHRGKIALRKLLQTSLKDEAHAFSLMPVEGQEWEETNIWCPKCGEVRLLGQYKQDESFALRCPRCEPDPQVIMAGLDLTKSYHASILGTIKTFKPAYKRVLSAFVPLYEQALQRHEALCIVCGSSLEVNITRIEKSADHFEHNILLFCPHCGWGSNKSIMGWVMALPQTQKFWQEHPRLRTLPIQEIEVQGSPVLLSGVESLTSTAQLEVVMRQDTFEVVDIRTNIKL